MNINIPIDFDGIAMAGGKRIADVGVSTEDTEATVRIEACVGGESPPAAVIELPPRIALSLGYALIAAANDRASGERLNADHDRAFES